MENELKGLEKDLKIEFAKNRSAYRRGQQNKAENGCKIDNNMVSKCCRNTVSKCTRYPIKSRGLSKKPWKTRTWYWSKNEKF